MVTPLPPAGTAAAPAGRRRRRWSWIAGALAVAGAAAGLWGVAGSGEAGSDGADVGDWPVRGNGYAARVDSCTASPSAPSAPAGSSAGTVRTALRARVSLANTGPGGADLGAVVTFSDSGGPVLLAVSTTRRDVAPGQVDTVDLTGSVRGGHGEVTCRVTEASRRARTR